MKLSKLLQEIEVAIKDNDEFSTWVSGTNIIEVYTKVEFQDEVLILDFEAQFYCSDEEVLSFEYLYLKTVDFYVDDENKNDSVSAEEILEIESKLEDFLKNRI